MSPSELEKYLHDHIPLSKAMEIGVIQVQPETVILSAPLVPNINHRDTVFGGSASAVAILAAWSLLHTRLSGEGIASRLVIQRNTMSYELPIDGTFTADAAIANAEAWEQFLRMLKRRGKARITVTSVLNFDGKVAGRFEGEFVALGDKAAQRPVNLDVMQLLEKKNVLIFRINMLGRRRMSYEKRKREDALRRAL